MSYHIVDANKMPTPSKDAYGRGHNDEIEASVTFQKEAKP